MSQTLAEGAQLSDSPVVAVMNGKGGVGKSTLALGLCAYTAQTHGTGLLVDCDPQGTAYELTGTLTDPGYEALHELDASQLEKIRQARGYDLIVVDCPGSLEGHDVLAAVLACTDFALIPFDHEVTSLPPTVRTAHFAAARVPCAVVVAMFPASVPRICWMRGPGWTTSASLTSVPRYAVIEYGARALRPGSRSPATPVTMPATPGTTWLES